MKTERALQKKWTMKKKLDSLPPYVILTDSTEMANLQITMMHLKDTPFGMGERKREFSSIDSLASNGGARKKRIAETRYISNLNS